MISAPTLVTLITLLTISQIEFVSLLSVLLAIYGVMGPLISTYEEKHDKFGNFHIPNEFGVLYCVLPCAVLAILFHPWVWNLHYMLNLTWVFASSHTLYIQYWHHALLLSCLVLNVIKTLLENIIILVVSDIVKFKTTHLRNI